MNKTTFEENDEETKLKEDEDMLRLNSCKDIKQPVYGAI